MGIHFFVLHSQIQQQAVIAKPKAKVHRITLSSVVVKKPVVLPPKPKVAPIILPPDPIVLPLKPKAKPKRVKKPKKKKVKKRTIKKPVIKPIEKIVEVIPPKPLVQQVVAPVVKVDTASIKDAYTAKIRRAIQQNLLYPKMAKRMRMQGVVRVAFRVLKDGSISNIRVINAPKKLLAKGAMKTLKSLDLEAIPSQLGESFMDINIPIEFKLVQG